MYVYKDGGTHALVAEPRQDLERRTAEIRVEEVGHLLHGCDGVGIKRTAEGAHAPSRVAAGRPSFESPPRILDRDTCVLQAEVRMMNYRPALASRANVAAVKLARALLFGCWLVSYRAR